MSEFIFQHQGEDKILIDSPHSRIIRTRKDFEIFSEHLESTVNEILLPQLHNNDFVRWMREVLYYNPNFHQIDLIRNFLTNESFYIRVEEDKLKFLRKYSDFIEKTWGLRSSYEHIGIFVDKNSEERLYELENRFIVLNKVKDELETNFTKQLTLAKLLNEKCEFLKQNLKYFISSSHHAVKIGQSFLNETNNKDIIFQLDDLAHIFSTITGLFERRREYYDKYRRIKEKLLKEKLQIESKEETLHNPHATLDELMNNIKRYNINLIEFLEKHEIATGAEAKIANLIRDINNILSNKYD